MGRATRAEQTQFLLSRSFGSGDADRYDGDVAVKEDHREAVMKDNWVRTSVRME